MPIPYLDNGVKFHTVSLVTVFHAAPVLHIEHGLAAFDEGFLVNLSGYEA